MCLCHIYYQPTNVVSWGDASLLSRVFRLAHKRADRQTRVVEGERNTTHTVRRGERERRSRQGEEEEEDCQEEEHMLVTQRKKNHDVSLNSETSRILAPSQAGQASKTSLLQQNQTQASLSLLLYTYIHISTAYFITSLYTNINVYINIHGIWIITAYFQCGSFKVVTALIKFSSFWSNHWCCFECECVWSNSVCQQKTDLWVSAVLAVSAVGCQCCAVNYVSAISPGVGLMCEKMKITVFVGSRGKREKE